MNLKDILLAIFVTFIWGVNFSVIKLGLNSLDPFILAGLRFTLSALPLVFFVKKPDVEFKYLIAYGLLFGIGLWGFAFLGIYFGISAGLSSLVVQMGTFTTVIFALIFLDEKFTKDKKLGLFVALLGLIAIFFVIDGSMSILGLVLTLIAAISMGLINIIVKLAKTKDIFSFLVWACVFSPIPLFLLAFVTGGSEVYENFFTNLDGNAIFSVLFLVYPTTLFGYWAWNKLLHKYDVSAIAPFGLLVPIFGLLGSFFILDEKIGFVKIIAGVLIVLGLGINTFGNRFFKEKKES